MTLGMRAMINQVSILAANIFVSCVLLVGTVLTGITFYANYVSHINFTDVVVTATCNAILFFSFFFLQHLCF
jgi:hypothetical protein